MILGFVTFGGTPNSHTAILARAMGIPALVGVGKIPDSCNDAFALLDASSGTLTVSPNATQIAEFERRRAEETELAKEHDRYLRSLISKPAVTRSGHKMLIYANVGSEEEALYFALSREERQRRKQRLTYHQQFLISLCSNSRNMAPCPPSIWT